MIIQLLKQSFFNRKRAMALMILSVAMGTAVSASLVTVALDISGKVTRELRSFGANIIIEPRVEGLADLAGQKRWLSEEDLPKAKTVFWRHNIVGIAPFLISDVTLSTGGNSGVSPVTRKVEAVGTWFSHAMNLPGEKGVFSAGIESVSPWWDLQGSPPSSDSGNNDVVMGVLLASELNLKAGDTVSLGTTAAETFTLSGILSTGGEEDRQVFLNLERMQRLLGLPGAVSRVKVSALTTPMDEFAYKDPATMSTAEYEKWYCTGYVTSISKQLEEVFRGSRARPIWRVAETEGRVLDRLSLLMYLLTASALIAAALGMSTTMAASMLRRLDEIGLMKALGADSSSIIYIFLTEAVAIGLIGGLLGYGCAVLTSDFIGRSVFQIALTQRGLLFPLSLGSALVIASLGALLPIRRALKVRPAIVLKEAL